MALTWAGRRQVLYSGVGAVIVCILLIVAYEVFFTAPPTCFDGKQDGTESGVDCGGTCSLICADEARPPVVEWTRAFETSPGIYSAVAYLQNNNPGAGARNVPYSFDLYDANNLLLAERDGMVDLPPLQTIPITESNINVGNGVVAHTLFALSEDPSIIAWNKIPAGTFPNITVSQQAHTVGYSKLSAMLQNNNVTDVQNVSVVAILYDANDVAIATSKSIIPRIAGNSQQQVVFTWPEGAQSAVRYEIIVLPAF